MTHHDHDTNRNSLQNIGEELKHHVPFTLVGSLTGIIVACVFVYSQVSHDTSHILFKTFHPAHVFFSALATAGMYRLHSKRTLLATFVVGYLGSVGIGTLSDCLIPYISELLLGLHDKTVHAKAHIGFIESWYIVNPLALLGIAFACWKPSTKIPHTGHVLLSTWASLFHLLMSISGNGTVGVVTGLMIPVVLFLAVWIPCCTSDIVFPLLLARGKTSSAPVQSEQR